jgi:carbonic anhydrase
MIEPAININYLISVRVFNQKKYINMKQENNKSDRRQFLQLGTATALGLLAGVSDLLGNVKPVQAATLQTTPDGALQKLMEGNQRYVEHLMRRPHQSQARLQEVSQSQHPFVTILSCADSRVLPEMIFDRGIGDIFDVRVAGNIATPEVLGSIEYAVALLETPVLMVLGHERCGAVTAAVKSESLANSQIESFVKAIKPSVERIKEQSGDLVDNAVIANVQDQIEKLKISPILSDRLESGKLQIVGGRYDLDTGKVTIIT